jgi:Tfp pilus assembly protein PilN
MEAVNLLPAYARPGHRWAAVGRDVSPHRVLTAGAAVACVAVVGLGLGYVHARSVTTDRRATLADVQTEVAAADAKAAPLRAAQSMVAARIPAATTVTSRRIVWESLLADLSRVLPRRVHLQSLSMQSPTPMAPVASAPATTQGAPTPAPAAGGAPFTVTGVATSHVRVALVLDRLAALPWLSNVTLVSSANSAAGGSLAAGDSFTVNADFNANGGVK